MRKSFRILLPTVISLILACKEKPAPQQAASISPPAADSTSLTAPTGTTNLQPQGALVGELGELPVWFDLRLPEIGGKVAGTYLYIKHGMDIPVSGDKKGDSLSLEETSGGKVTGIFDLKRLGGDGEDEERWVGTWNKPGKRKSLPVFLRRVPSGFKACHLADPESLMISEGVSLATEMSAKTPSSEVLEDQSKSSGEEISAPELAITGCANGLMSAEFTVMYYPGYGPIVDNSRYLWTFDLVRKKEVRLWEEIDSTQAGSFAKYLRKALTPRLQEMNTGIMEEAGEPAAGKPAPFEIQSLENVQIKINEGRIMVGFDNYFEISELRSIEKQVGREAWEEIPPSDLRKFLKKNSALNAFAAESATANGL